MQRRGAESQRDFVAHGRTKLDKAIGLVTGGARGLGYASATKLMQMGLTVVIADLDEFAARNSAVRLVEENNGLALGIRVDVADEGSVATMVKDVLDLVGRIDVLVNNAAATERAHVAADSAITEMNIDVWNRTLRVNLTGAMLCAKYVLRSMLEGGRPGSVINMGSVNQLLGFDHLTGYGVAKAGLHSLTMHIATQYGRNSIRANTVCAGVIMTEAVKQYMKTSNVDPASRARTIPLPYVGTPEDVANAVAFFASDASRYVSGQILVVDGGQFSHAPHVDFDNLWNSRQ